MRRVDAMPDTTEGAEAWRDFILANEQEGMRALHRLAQEDYESFRTTCLRLARDSSLLVRRVAFEMLTIFAKGPDPVAEASALEALDIPDLTAWALLALGKIGTSTSFAVLLPYAERGFSQGLAAAARQAHTEAQRQAVSKIAQQHLWSDNSNSREMALIWLPRLSPGSVTEEVLLALAKRYYDEFVFGRLRRVSVKILPELREMLTAFDPDYAEYHDILKAIQAIERRHGLPITQEYVSQPQLTLSAIRPAARRDT